MKPYPCKAAYAAGSRDARVLPSCFHSLDDMSADGYATLRNEALMCFEPGCDIHRSGARMKTHMFKKIRKQIARALTLRHGYGCGLFNLSGFLFFIFDFPGMQFVWLFTQHKSIQISYWIPAIQPVSKAPTRDCTRYHSRAKPAHASPKTLRVEGEVRGLSDLNLFMSEMTRKLALRWSSRMLMIQ